MSSLGNWNPTKLPKNDGKSNTVKSWSQPRSNSNSHPSPPPPPPPLDHNLSSIRNVRSFALSSHTTSLTLNLPRLVKILFEIFFKFDLWMNFFNFFGIRMVRLSSLSIFFSTHLFHFSFDWMCCASMHFRDSRTVLLITLWTYRSVCTRVNWIRL